MMELSHSLTLNEGALQQLPPEKRPHFVFEWLRFLDKVLTAAHKSDIKGCQQKLVAQLTSLLQEAPGPPARRLLARCLATLFSVGDTFLLFETVNKCNDILKVKDDSPSYLPTRLAAICCLGSMYEKLGRMMGRSYEETVQTLVRSLKSSESQTRLEIISTLEKICVGMGSAAPLAIREVSRAARQCLLSDRAPAVRSAAAHALAALVPLTKLTQAELDNTAAACVRALDGSCYQVRCAVAELLGALIAATQAGEVAISKARPGAQIQQSKNAAKNVTSLEEALNLLMGSFLRGGTSFLKGEIIKAGSGVNREVRVGVTHAYVIFVQTMGGSWLERNLVTFLNHVLDLVANPKAASSHVDAVYSRKCINHILRSTLGKMIGEKAQASACKEIIQIIVKQMNSIDFNPENAKDCNQETLFSQHLLVCALTEAGELMLTLGTSVQNLILDQSLNMIEAICTVLVHPCQAARLAAAWCLRCLCVAVPAQITPLIDKCVDTLDNMRTSPEAISGYSAALAAALGAVHLSPLGVPHGRGKVAFNAAEQLLRSAGQSSRLSAARTNAGWLIVGAICTLGVPVVRGLLPRMLLLWRNSFPRSNKELESEKARGDAFTWQVTLEGRAGALSALHSLLAHCSTLANNDDTAKRLSQPVEGALAVLTSIQPVLRQYGAQLKAPAALLRLRLCECAALLPPPAAAATAPLLRVLAAELTLADINGGAVASGLLRTAGHPRDAVLLGSAGWIIDTDHANIEDQLVSMLSACGSGALEHDPCCLYRPLPPGQTCPGPLPLGVAVIDASVILFGQIFPRAANKHRLQMLEHFAECIRVAKSSRQEALQINIFTALLLGLKGIAELKSSVGPDDVRNSATTLIVAGLSSANPWVRCAAAQCAGRLCSVSEANRADALAERLWALARTGRGAARAGAAAALGAVLRARGARVAPSAGALPVLVALAQDGAGSGDVQVWSLHALSLMADAGGPMFRSCVEPTLAMALKLLFSVPAFHEDIHRCIGRLLSALITVVGPELQGNASSICAVRSTFLCACAIMQECGVPAAQAEAIGCLQQLHLFAPRHLNLATLVPTLCRNLSSKHLVLRRAALSCLRQLSQREAADVCRHAMLLASEQAKNEAYHGVTISDTGLPGALFAYLDVERDRQALSFARDALACTLQAIAARNEGSGAASAGGGMKEWLTLCKKVLTVKQDDSSNPDLDMEGDPDDEGDQAEFHADTEQSTHPPVQPRWPTRVFAMECVQKIMTACEATSASHFDVIKAKEELLTKANADYLVLHLSDLVRMAFVAATSEADQLRLAGLATLRQLITSFSQAAEPEFPGHLLLEQYQAQVGAALRPAFTSDTPSHVTAAACDVCSTWIGSGVARDINDLRRVHQLLVSSLSKLNTKANTTQIYNESMSTLEKLSILKAWAEVYIVAMVSNGSAPGSYIKQLQTNPPPTDTSDLCDDNIDNAAYAKLTYSNDDYGDFESKGESLLKLVAPELENLGENWLAALRDHALLGLPPEFSSQLPHSGGAFYSADTAEAARLHYCMAWPSLLYAAALRFNAQCKDGLYDVQSTEEVLDNRTSPNGNNDNGNSEFFEPVDEKFHLLFGICMEALCAHRDTCATNTVNCLLSLMTLLDTSENRARLLKDRSLAIELCHILHRIGLTQETIEPLILASEVLQLVITAAKEELQAKMQAKIKELAPESANNSDQPIPTSVLEAVHLLGEGGPTGDLPPGKSLVFACLELALCLLVRRLPALSPLKQEGKVGVIGVARGLGVHGDTLLTKALDCMAELPNLTSPQGALSILPSILYLATGVLKEAKSSKLVSDAGISLLTAAANSPTPLAHSDTREQWGNLLQSALSKVIDLVKNDDPATQVSPIVGVRAMSVLLPRATPSSALHYPCINHFRHCLESHNQEVIRHSAQCVRHLWRVGGGSWARALAPRLIASLARARSPAGPEHLSAVVACVAAVEELTACAEGDGRVQMLWLLVPIVISYLRDGAELGQCSSSERALHDFSLQWLTKIGPKYPQEFKLLMQQSAELRGKLESAVKASQLTATQKQQQRANAQAALLASRTAKPAIQLKTDFSDFR